MSIKVLKNIRRLYTNEKIAAKDGRHLLAADLAPIENAALVYDSARGRVLWAGLMSKFPKKYARIRDVRDLKNRTCVMPGLIDSHTHLVFAGDRASEFARRCAGATYAEIAAEGGGILTTVRATREASETELLKLAVARARQAFAMGTRTIEIKSGYGLDAESELKCLRVVQALQKKIPEMTFVPTFLGAHAIPKGQTADQWIDEMCATILPVVARKKLAQYCDIFIDEGYFDLKHGRRLLARAKELGLGIRVHADELGFTSATELGVEMGAASVDHLLKISANGIRELSKSKTVATLLPGTAFYLKEAHAPARALLDAGAKVALSTDFNPGTCVTLDLQFITTLSALYLKMNSAELMAAITVNAADSLGLDKRKGRLMPGFDSDFFEIPYESYEQWYYHL